jgi:hypothetical protein
MVAFSPLYEDMLADEGIGRTMTAVVDDLNDQLDVICGFANLGAEASNDAERTESLFARIESAGEQAAQITRQLLVLDPAPQAAAPIKSRPTGSSFRRRLVAAREAD